MKINTKSWGNKPIEEFSRWEQREIYSYQDIDEQDTKLELVNKIVQVVNDSSDLNWAQDDLDLISESLIQKKLRDNNNLEIKCWKLDNFPTSIAELKLLVYSATTSKLKTKLQLRNITDSLWVPLSIIFSVIGLIYYKFDLIGWCFLASYIICNTVTLIIHEKWAHNILVPKNRYVGYLLDFYAYFISHSTSFHSFNSPPKAGWVQHLYHHRFYNTKNDHVKDELSNGRLRYYFMWFMKIDQNLMRKHIKMVRKDYREMYNKLDKVEKFLENHSFKLVVISHIILFFTLGIHYYFYFVFLPCACFRNVLQLVESFCYDEDNFWLFPLVLGHAYHASHHNNSNKLILGPAISKYLNIQFYFVKLFYHVRTEILWVNQFKLPIHDRLIKLLPYKNLILTIVSVFGLFYYKFDLLGWAVLEAWFISNLIFLNIN